jgi:hypothetical protein
MSCTLFLPFGIEHEYGKSIIKLELDNNKDDHQQLKKVIQHIEKLVIKKIGRVRVVNAIAVPKISIVICLVVFFFLDGSPASIIFGPIAA